MAKVFSPPTEIHVPDFDEAFVNGRYSMEKDNELHEKFYEDLRSWLAVNYPNHKLRGEIVRFQVADGYAQYMIVDGTTMIHLPLGDAYAIPDAHARGLRASDLSELVESRKRLDALFGRK